MKVKSKDPVPDKKTVPAKVNIIICIYTFAISIANCSACMGFYLACR